LKNRLLQLLRQPDQERLTRDSVVTSLRLKKKLYGTEDPIDAVYFPVDCMTSILVGAEESAGVEMATIGNEGVVGAYSILSTNRAIGETLVQVAGDAVRLDSTKFRGYINENGPFRDVIQRYLFALTREVLQAGGLQPAAHHE
jgi:hypothetical protein